MLSLPIKCIEKDTDVLPELSFGPCCGILFLLIYASIDSHRIVLWSLLLFFALVSVARARIIKIQCCSTFISLRRSGLFSDMATGRRGSDLSEMSQSLAGLRFNMFLIAFPIFSVLYVQFEGDQLGDFNLFYASLFLPLHYYVVLKWSSNLNRWPVCLFKRSLYQRNGSFVECALRYKSFWMFVIFRVLYTVTKYQENYFKSRFVTPTRLSVQPYRRDQLCKNEMRLS